MVGERLKGVVVRRKAKEKARETKKAADSQWRAGEFKIMAVLYAGWHVYPDYLQGTTRSEKKEKGRKNEKRTTGRNTQKSEKRA